MRCEEAHRGTLGISPTARRHQDFGSAYTSLDERGRATPHVLPRGVRTGSLGYRSKIDTTYRMGVANPLGYGRRRGLMCWPSRPTPLALSACGRQPLPHNRWLRWLRTYHAATERPSYRPSNMCRGEIGDRAGKTCRLPSPSDSSAARQPTLTGDVEGKMCFIFPIGCSSFATTPQTLVFQSPVLSCPVISIFLQ